MNKSVASAVLVQNGGRETMLVSQVVKIFPPCTDNPTIIGQLMEAWNNLHEGGDNLHGDAAI